MPIESGLNGSNGEEEETANKTYLCKDQLGEEPIKHLYVFKVITHKRFAVIQNPTEMGLVRQDNMVELPDDLTVIAMAECAKKEEESPLGNNNVSLEDEEEFKDEDGTDWYNVLLHFSRTRSLISVLDHNRLHPYLVITDVSAEHSTQLPDLDVFTIRLTNIMDARRLDGESDSDEGQEADGGSETHSTTTGWV